MMRREYVESEGCGVVVMLPYAVGENQWWRQR